MTLDPWHTLYLDSSSNRGTVSSPWSSDSSGGIELDLRKEMKEFLHGSAGEIAKGRTGLLRRIRTDSGGEKVKCPCRDTVTDEPDRDYYCRQCNGTGYLWDERELVYYKDDGSLELEEEVLFYVEYFVEPAKEDYVVELTRDIDGSIVSNKERRLYKITEAEPFRSDNGRVEYWRCRTKYMREWSVWYGVPSRQHEPTTES